MNAIEKSTEYAQKIKALLVQMAIDDTLPMDMTTLDTKKIEAILKPVFGVLALVEQDAQMALDGSWDVSTDEGLEGFDCQLTKIDLL